MTEQPYTNKHGRYSVPPDETTFAVHSTIKGSAALKEYFKKRQSRQLIILRPGLGEKAFVLKVPESSSPVRMLVKIRCYPLRLQRISSTIILC